MHTSSTSAPKKVAIMPRPRGSSLIDEAGSSSGSSMAYQMKYCKQLTDRVEAPTAYLSGDNFIEYNEHKGLNEKTERKVCCQLLRGNKDYC